MAGIVERNGMWQATWKVGRKTLKATIDMEPLPRNPEKDSCNTSLKQPATLQASEYTKYRQRERIKM